MLVRALCMSNERKCECLFQEAGRQLPTPQTAKKRTSMPICPHVAPSIVNVQSQCTGQPLDLVDHRDAFERLPGKILKEAWDVGGVDNDGVRTIQLWLPGQRRPTDPLGL